MFIVGVYDDLYNADFKLKFILQIIVAKIIIDQGFVIDSFHGVFGVYELPRIFSQIFTGFVFLVIVSYIIRESTCTIVYNNINFSLT